MQSRLTAKGVPFAIQAGHVPTITGAGVRAAVPVAWRTTRWHAIPWHAIATETVFVLGLGTLCVALVALRMAVWPHAFIPRGLAFATFGVTTLVTIGTFLGAAAMRRRGYPRRRA